MIADFFSHFNKGPSDLKEISVNFAVQSNKDTPFGVSLSMIFFIWSLPPGKSDWF